MSQGNTADKMRTTPVNKLMLSMGIPMIISMILQAFYNIVDSAFVSNMAQNGEAALNALTLAFPIQMLMVALGIGTGVGTNALVSKCLGQSDRKKAGQAAGNAVFLGAVIYAVCVLFGIFGVRPYLSTQTTNTLILDMAESYLTICCTASFGMIFFSIYEKLLQATGLSIYSTIAQIVGAVMNIILDPILIYGLLGLPEMGVIGAALATVIGQIASFIIALFFHLKSNKAIPNGFKYIKPSGILIRDIYAIGFPAIIAQALMSVMAYTLNVILVKIDEAMVTAYGLYYKIQQFVLFAAFGLRDAITPIVSYSHGMGSRERIKEGIRCGIKYTLFIMGVGMILLEILAVPLTSAFGLSGTTESLCISAIRIISLSFLFAGFNIALQGVFQALEGGIESLVVSVCRQFIFVVPVALAFSTLALKSMDSAWTVWLTFPIAEFASAIISWLFLRRTYKKKINNL